MTLPPVLIVLSGLPGTGKSTVARKLAGRIVAVWLRIDTIEQAIRDSRALTGPIEDAGYRAACGIAADNLRLGLNVVADCVNDCMLARDAWTDLGAGAGARVVEVESIGSDAAEHRRRVEARMSEVPGLKLPTWAEIIGCNDEPWDRHHLIIDTARSTLAQCVATILAAL